MISSEKYIKFLEKLLEKTKRGEITWKRYRVAQSYESWANESMSFSCIAGTMKIYMLSDKVADTIHFDIQYDDTLPNASWEPTSTEEKQIALRLVNYVYSLFPNLEKSIDLFLNDN